MLTQLYCILNIQRTMKKRAQLTCGRAPDSRPSAREDQYTAPGTPFAVIEAYAPRGTAVSWPDQLLSGKGPGQHFECSLRGKGHCRRSLSQREVTFMHLAYETVIDTQVVISSKRSSFLASWHRPVQRVATSPLYQKCTYRAVTSPV